MGELISLYYKFWEILGYSITKTKEFITLCDQIKIKKKIIKKLFIELRELKNDNPDTEALDIFYHTFVIGHPYRPKESSDVSKVS